MNIINKKINLSTKGHTDIIDITEKVKEALMETKLKKGIVNISIAGSTAGITTCEYEPALIRDLKDFFDTVAPRNKPYHHDVTWGDANGYAHIRSSLIGTTKSFSFGSHGLNLGNWQQVVFIDFDNRPRQREINLQFIGE